jgi:hypothetical protein
MTAFDGLREDWEADLARREAELCGDPYWCPAHTRLSRWQRVLVRCWAAAGACLGLAAWLRRPLGWPGWSVVVVVTVGMMVAVAFAQPL